MGSSWSPSTVFQAASSDSLQEDNHERIGSLLLLAGRLGDLIGRKRILVVGLSVFTAASLVCGLAPSPQVLIGARFVQGIGAALVSAVVLGMIVTLFPPPEEQARAISIYAFVAAGGASIGLLAGGALTQAINWHWIFYVNVPIGIATALAAARLLDRDDGLGFAREDRPTSRFRAAGRAASMARQSED